MAKSFTVEVPSICESSLTGFIGRAIKKVRNVVWTVELWQHGTIIYRDGQRIEWNFAPMTPRRLAHKLNDFLKSTPRSA